MQWWGRYEYCNRYEYPLFRYWPTLLSLFTYPYFLMVTLRGLSEFH